MSRASRRRIQGDAAAFVRAALDHKARVAKHSPQHYDQDSQQYCDDRYQDRNRSSPFHALGIAGVVSDMKPCAKPRRIAPAVVAERRAYLAPVRQREGDKQRLPHIGAAENGFLHTKKCCLAPLPSQHLAQSEQRQCIDAGYACYQPQAFHSLRRYIGRHRPSICMKLQRPALALVEDMTGRALEASA